MNKLNDITIGTPHEDGTGSQLKAIEFKTVYETDYNTVMVAQSDIDTGDAHHRLVVEIVNMLEATGDEQFAETPFICRIGSVIDPAYITKKMKKDVLDSQCLGSDEKVSAADLWEYGYRAILDESEEQLSKDFTAWINERASRIAFLYGFYMDRSQNAIGTDGWHFIKGEY